MLHHHYHVVHPRLRGARLVSPRGFPNGSLSPAQVLTAYGFRQNQYAGALPVKLGVGSLGGGVVQADLDNAVAAWGMAPPALTVFTAGGAENDPTVDQDSNVENMLDLELVSFTWWWLTGTPADVTIAFGPNTGGGMKAATAALAAAGVEVASWSWGAAAADWEEGERHAFSRALAHAVANGVTFFAASGDDSLDDGLTAPSADYPCSDPSVWAVGGTRLTVAADGARAGEAAWGDGRPGDSGGGGGYDPTVPAPAWQVSALPRGELGFRGVPDTAANADPDSGWQISANGAWTVVGGTSAASPFTAALVAVAKGVAKMLGEGLATPAVYATPSACNDITTGSNGDPAEPGWDPATGLGSPRGDAFVQALAAYARDPAAHRASAEPLTTVGTAPPPKLGVDDVVALLRRAWPRS